MEDEETETLGTSEILKMRNTINIFGLASTGLRFQLSNRETAACASAYLGDLIAAGILPAEAAYLAVDPDKVQRARDRLMEEARDRGLEQCQEDNPHCILFYARIDQTRVLHFDEKTKKYYPRVEKEDHYTVTDGDGVYLTHITKPGKNLMEEEGEKEEELEDFQLEENMETKETTSEEAGRKSDTTEETLSDVQKELKKKPAEVVARMIVEWIREQGLVKTLELIGGDSTKSNTGWRAGIIAWIEKLIGKKLHWLICQVHTNELGLRCLITKTDGKSDSKKGFSGPLGKRLKKVSEMKHNPNFMAVPVGPDLIALPPDIVKSLSTDANLAYLRCLAVRSGHLPRDVALRKTGEIVHSRWLTTGSTFLDFGPGTMDWRVSCTLGWRP
jgi:hypothetical protein